MQSENETTVSKPYVLVQGLGLNQGGLGVAKYFAQKGKNVVVTDLKTADQLKSSVQELEKYSNVSLVLGEHREDDFSNAELIIANPAVPPTNFYLQAAKKAHIPVHTEMTYFFSKKRCKTIGITGTRGKSTTTNLLYQILKSASKNVFLGGNLGISVMELIDSADQNAIAVLELSSFMLEWMRDFQESPDVGALTNIMLDHLSRHQTMDEYIDVKSTIFKFQNEDGLAILNIDDANVKALEKHRKVGKTVTYGKHSKKNDYCIDNGFVLESGNPLFALSSVVDDSSHPLAGEHNEYNILCATAIARQYQIATETIENSIVNYEGLYGRQMFLNPLNEVKIVNDTCATTPDAVIAGLKRFEKETLVLLCGGADKELDYSGLAIRLKEKPLKAIVVLVGSGSDKLLTQMKKNKVDTPVYAGLLSLEAAVSKSIALVEEGDTILFSPGGTSFEMFENEFDRGRKFDEIVDSYR